MAYPSICLLKKKGAATLISVFSLPSITPHKKFLEATSARIFVDLRGMETCMLIVIVTNGNISVSTTSRATTTVPHFTLSWFPAITFFT